jgi:hypothetical protein
MGVIMGAFVGFALGAILGPDPIDAVVGAILCAVSGGAYMESKH